MHSHGADMCYIAALLYTIVMTVKVGMTYAADPSPMIDWGSCSWSYWGTGDVGSCGTGIAVGACATRDLARCGSNPQRTHGLECCNFSDGQSMCIEII